MASQAAGPMAGYAQRAGDKHSITADKDAMVAFCVMWALAEMLSVVSHYDNMMLRTGLKYAALNYATLGVCLALIAKHRNLWLLFALSCLMGFQYIMRLPVASNNQTIAFFMNTAIVLVIGTTWLRGRTLSGKTIEIYESLRIVARLLLATMYFYGIFHKINTGFLDPEASCATALYRPLVHMFGLQDNLLGQYGAIAATFIVESITLVCLFWRRFFAFGLIIGLVFHYIIPISAYSWYMDFSCLVFALYTLSIPVEVSLAYYAKVRSFLSRIPALPASAVAIAAMGGLFALGYLIASFVQSLDPQSSATTGKMLWHSTWIIFWSVLGGFAMIWLTGAALSILPYRVTPIPKHPKWIYAIPGVLFLSCLSPYLGLKTESSIAMFSNLHTEGGETNHLLFPNPPYIAPYQAEVLMVTGSSIPRFQRLADQGKGLVPLEMERALKSRPNDWISYTLNGKQYDRVTAADWGPSRYNKLETQLLLFKPVEFSDPQICTH